MAAEQNIRTAIIGIVTVSDRASQGLYEDKGGPAIAAYLEKILARPSRTVRKIMPGGIESVRETLIDLAEREHCGLLLTPGVTGPPPRDLSTETTEACTQLVLPAFGERMRMASLKE